MQPPPGQGNPPRGRATPPLREAAVDMPSMGRDQVLGERVEILVRNRGETIAASRGWIEVEDLSHVVTRLAVRRGPNGPNSAVTQYILSEAARHLAEHLGTDLRSDPSGESVPRVLSALVGHEPFVEGKLNLSGHHMRRRWPFASDWYADLISYVLRPQRHLDNLSSTMLELNGWMQLPFGQFVKNFAEQQVKATQDPDLFRIAEVMYHLWPTYEPIRLAYRRHREAVEASWTPLYRQLLHHYGLELQPGVELSDLCWVFDALVERAGQETSLSFSPSHLERLIRSILVHVAGATRTQDGHNLSQYALSLREPVLNS